MSPSGQAGRKARRAELDPVTLSVVWNRLIAIANEMGLTLSRTAYSDAVREAQDFGTHVYDAQGRLVAQGMCSPGHLGASLTAVSHALAAYPRDTLRRGDCIVFNLPGLGAGHLPDFVLVTPAFLDDGELVGFTASTAHQADVGGLSAGSMTIPGVMDLYQEGLVIPPSLLLREGQPTDVHRLILANVRVPTIVQGDINAQLSANEAGSRGLRALVERYGRRTLADCMDEIIARSETEMRAAIRALPEGSYEGEDWLDDFGPGTPPIRVHVRVQIAESEITLDFSGSSDQVPAAMNSYLSYTYAYAFFTVKCFTLPDLPQNHGTCRPVRVRAREGCFFNPVHPAPCSGRALTAHRMFNAIMLAIAEADPQRSVACHSEFSMALIGGRDPKHDRIFTFFEIMAGGFGARPTKDGPEGMFSVINARNIPVEVYETSNPVLVQRYELVCDTGGPGRFRGGCSAYREMRILAPQVSFINLCDRFKFDPYGLAGGLPGARGMTHLNPSGPQPQGLESKGVYTLREGDVVGYRCSGAGGFGDPLTRDPLAVRHDVERGFVSLEGAARDYGVVLDAPRLALDLPATEVLRARLRQAAQGQATPERGSSS